MLSPRAAVRCLHIGRELTLTLEQAEAAARRAHGHPERGPREHLTIGAIAQVDLFGIDLGCVAHPSAMARALNLHEPSDAPIHSHATWAPALDWSALWLGSCSILLGGEGERTRHHPRLIDRAQACQESAPRTM